MPKYHKFQPDKTLPATLLDCVLKHNGITSPEFQGAVKKGDAKNVMEGIDSIILNAETKTHISLSDRDRFMVSLMAQDMVTESLLAKASLKGNRKKLENIYRNISNYNKVAALILKSSGEYKRSQAPAAVTKEQADHVAEIINGIDRDIGESNVLN